jgi:flagellar hook-associated protein FlgK
MNFSIGLTGLTAAQRAIELIGTNLANAATEGYHRQTLNLSPIELAGPNTRVSFGGVEIIGVNRGYDLLLEREHLRQQPMHGQVKRELTALTSIEAVLGQVEGDPLTDSIQEFYGALMQLAADPNSLAYAQNSVWTADAMAQNIRSASEFLQEMKDMVYRSAQELMGELNVKVENIASLNGEIELAIRRGASANLLMDQRDQMVTECAKMVEVQSNNMDASGQINISAWGTPLVVSENFMKMEVGMVQTGEILQIGVAPEGQLSYNPNVTGGEIGGLIKLYNDIIPEMEERLDTLAQQIMHQMNRRHVQGLPLEGSFDRVQGVPIDSSQVVGAWGWPEITDGGTFHFRITDDTGAITTYEIEIREDDYIADIVDRINNLPTGADVQASVVSGRMIVETVTEGYSFDFVPDYSLNTLSVTENMVGFGVDAATDDYFEGMAAGAGLTLDLGTTAGEILSYTVGAATKTLNDVVTEINVLSQAAHAGWNAAEAYQNPTTGQYHLRLNAYQGGDLSDGEISVSNVGSLRWAWDSSVVGMGETGGFVVREGQSGLQGTGSGTDAPAVEIDGLYQGDNQTFKFVVGGTGGNVGVDSDLTVSVYDEEGNLVRVLNVGNGYAAKDRLEVADDMVVTFSEGQLNAGETFSITARSVSDTSGFLEAAGLNTFFEGSTAADIEVREQFFTDPHLIATAAGGKGEDSRNIQIMAEVAQTRLTELGNATISDYHRDFVADIGQQTMIRESKLKAVNAIVQQLANQRDEISGVDPNNEAAQLLIYERMFQSMAKFINTQDRSLETLMDMI